MLSWSPGQVKKQKPSRQPAEDEEELLVKWEILLTKKEFRRRNDIPVDSLMYITLVPL
jgi:hypothetical protein